MLSPRGVKHLQQHMAAEAGPGVVPDQIFLSLFNSGCGLKKLIEQVFIGGVIARFEHALHIDVDTPIVLEVTEQTVEIPLFFHRFGRYASAEEIREVSVAQILDHFAHVGAFKNLVAQTINFATLIVLNVVKLQELLTDVVVRPSTLRWALSIMRVSILLSMATPSSSFRRSAMARMRSPPKMRNSWSSIDR